MTIQDLIERARYEPPHAPANFPIPGVLFVCRVNDPEPWSPDAVEQAVGFPLPDRLRSLWDACGGMALYEDNLFHQSGLVVLAPAEAIAESRALRRDRREEARPGDLVFARFHGDFRLAILRCDASATDLGAVMIVAPTDSREDWYTAAPSLEAFIGRYMDEHGGDYWDVHYQEILAARTGGARDST